MILGFGSRNFFDSYDLLNKILWAGFSIGTLAAIMMIYNYLRFYDYSEHYFIAALFLVLFIVFEIKEFQYFRKNR